MKRLAWLVISMILILLFSAPSAQATVGLKYGKFKPRVAVDVNPDPGIVEVVLEAKVSKFQFFPGSPSTVYTYVDRNARGQSSTIPGPTIQGKAGDLLIVHFFNSLPEETTIHWHGMETPANMDGSNISQLTVEPGGYFRYEFRMLSPATYWYHPHIRVNVQVENGLYGMLVVRDPETDAALGLPTNDRVVMLDDVLLDENNQIAEEFPEDPVERAEMMLNGREGNLLLVNGRAGRVLKVRIGVPQRWRMANVANARFMRFSIPGHTFYRIGGDGGLLEHPIAIPEIEMIPNPDFPDENDDGFDEPEFISNPDPSQGLLLTVAERADIIFTPQGKPGDLIPMEWHDWPRGLHTTFRRPDGSIAFPDAPEDGKRQPQPLMWLRLLGRPQDSEFIPPDNLRDIEEIAPNGAETLVVTFGHTPPDSETGDVLFFAARKMVNGGMVPLPFDAVTSADAQDVIVNTTRVWEITNLSGADHPFHTHGWFFQPFETEFICQADDEECPIDATWTCLGEVCSLVEPFPFTENKDTIRIPGRPGSPKISRTVVRAAVFFSDEGREGLVVASDKEPTADESGGWVFHCHINEHSALGMMSFFEVLYGNGP